MDMIKIVGTRDTSFTSQEGKQINGVSVFFTMPEDKVKGLMAGKHFISLDALGAFSVQPEVGLDVQVLYNRFGKVENYLPCQGGGEVAPLPGEEVTKKR